MRFPIAIMRILQLLYYGYIYFHIISEITLHKSCIDCFPVANTAVTNDDEMEYLLRKYT